MLEWARLFTLQYVGVAMYDPDLERLVATLVGLPQMQALWLVKDRGMPVFAHTVDVTMLCLERIAQGEAVAPSLDVRVVALGSLMHDLSKASARLAGVQSHSHIMSHYPELAAAEAVSVLNEALARAGLALPERQIEGITHVVVSHHGPWGRVRPQTPEARLVHSCDLYSAMNHRLAPIDANDILPHLDLGRRWSTTSALLGVGIAVLRQRINDACQAEAVEDWKELLRIWRQHGRVRVGDSDRVRQLERVRFVLRSAREVPDSVLRVLASL